MSNANEPAFPTDVERAAPFSGGYEGNKKSSGLTKREYFAGLALQAETSALSMALSSQEMLLAASRVMTKKGFTGEGSQHRYIANEAVRLADALLAELARSTKEEQ